MSSNRSGAAEAHVHALAGQTAPIPTDELGDAEDPLDGARGIAIAMTAAVPIWAAIGVIAWRRRRHA
jgi:hypothetical protein